MFFFSLNIAHSICGHCPGGQIHPGLIQGLVQPSILSRLLSAWYFRRKSGSKPRHGCCWYIPWESTGYPQAIITATQIFVFFFFFSSFDDFPGRLFSNGGTMRVIISCNFFSSSVNENTVNNPGSALKQTWFSFYFVKEIHTLLWYKKENLVY